MSMVNVRGQIQGPGLGLGFVLGNVCGQDRVILTVRIWL